MERTSGAAVSQLPCSPYSGAAPPPGAFLPPPFLAAPGVPPANMRNLDDRPIRGNPSGQYNLHFFDSVNEYEHAGRHPAHQRPTEWVAPPARDADSATATFRLSSGHRGPGIDIELSVPAVTSSSERMALNDRPPPPPVPNAYRLFLQRLTSTSNGLSTAEFAREFPYEELLLLDECVPANHRGLRPSEMHGLLVRAQGRLRSLLPVDDVNGSSAARPCSICLIPLSSSITCAPRGERRSDDDAPRDAEGEGVPSPGASVVAATTLHHPVLCSSPPAAERHRHTDPDGATDCVVLPCFHEFHRGCIQRWLTSATTCPVCRDDVRTEPLPGD